LGTLYTWNVVSPRLGVTAKLSANGRTMLRASYGRFNQGVLTGELSPIHPGVTPTRTMAFDAATGDYTQLISVVDPKINLELDARTPPPRTDEYSVGVERQLTARLAASAAYIRKSGANFIAWTDTGGTYTEETRTLSGYSVPVFVLANAPRDRRFLLTNPADFSMDYHGLVVALNRRLSNWQASGSYTFSRVGGLQASRIGIRSSPRRRCSSRLTRPFSSGGCDTPRLGRFWYVGARSARQMSASAPAALRRDSLRLSW
jgi:hypothetical protein